MTDLITFLLLLPFGIVSLMAFFVVVQALFAQQVQHVPTSLSTASKRSFLMGLINLLFVGIIALALIAVGEDGGFPPFSLLGLIIAGVATVIIIFGLVGIAQVIGARLQPKQGDTRRLLVGSLALILACLFPLLGWFLLLPYASILGFGGYLNGALAARRVRRANRSA